MAFVLQCVMRLGRCVKICTVSASGHLEHAPPSLQLAQCMLKCCFRLANCVPWQICNRILSKTGASSYSQAASCICFLSHFKAEWAMVLSEWLMILAQTQTHSLSSWSVDYSISEMPHTVVKECHVLKHSYTSKLVPYNGTLTHL